MRVNWRKKMGKIVMAAIMSVVMVVVILPMQQLVYADIDPNMADATAVTYGGKINGTLKEEGDSKYYTFTTSASLAYYNISAKSNTEDAQFEASVRDADNQEIVSMIFDSEETVLPVPELEKNTKYYLCVSIVIADGAAGYSIKIDQLLDDHENTVELAKEVAVGSTTEGKLETTTDVDVLKFTTGVQDAFYEILYSNIDSPEDIELQILDEQGIVFDTLIVNSKSQGKLILKLDPSKVYYLQMQASWEVGSYSLQVKSCIDEGGEDFEHAQAVDFNPTIAGGLQSATDLDYFSITAAQELVEYQLVVVSAPTNEQTIIVDVYDYNQTYMQEISDMVEPGNTVTKNIKLEPGQVYYVAISGMNAGDTYILQFIDTKQEASDAASKGESTLPVVTPVITPVPQVATEQQQGQNTTVEESEAQTSVTGAAITATENDKVALKSVKLNKSKLTVKVGKKKTLKVVVSPKSIGVKSKTWSVTKKKIASVSKKGVVMGLKKGITKVKCKVVLKNGTKKNVSCKVTVK